MEPDKGFTVEATRRDYEPPAIVMLGTVEGLTRIEIKMSGGDDGLGYARPGGPISSVS